MLESHSYGSLSACQPWLPDFLTSTNPSAAQGKVQSRGQAQCLQECNDEVRICAHCGTSKTPLWRNGPQGPKSLCNACGIRHKKAGRRSAATSSLELQGCHSVTAGAVKGGKRKLEEELEPQYWIYERDSQAPKLRGESFVQPADSLLSGTSCMTWQRSLLRSPQCFVQRDCHPPLPSIQKGDMLQRNAFTSDEEEGAVLLMALFYGMVYA